MPEVDGEKFVAEEEFGVVHFDRQKICTQTCIYDLNGEVDVHVNPEDHAINAMEPGMFGGFAARVPARSLSEIRMKAHPEPPKAPGQQ